MMSTLFRHIWHAIRGRGNSGRGHIRRRDGMARRRRLERPGKPQGARGRAPAARAARPALLALLAGSIALGGITAPAGPAPAQAAPAPPAAGVPAAAAAAGAAEEQPQSWLLKWSDPALAHELRGVEVLRRQEAAAVEEIRPAADAGEDVDAWLSRLRGEPGVEYVHPNGRVRVLAAAPQEGAVPSEAAQEAAADERTANAAPSVRSEEQPEPQGGLGPPALPEAPQTAASSDKLPAAVSDSLPATPSDSLPATLPDSSTAASSESTSAAPTETDSSAGQTSLGSQGADTGGTAGAAAGETAGQADAGKEPAYKGLAAGAASSGSAAIQSAQSAAQTSAKPNDPELGKQQHLQMIGAEKAWQTVRSNTDIVIALVDTGVDLDHPDLKDNLVAGRNLVHPKLPPEDDNGHGTSVAGVLAAVGNNGKGVAGVLWQAKVMPIKALDGQGDGTEKDLGEGILYAVNNGADIVVLSVGLYRYSPYMRDIVQYAESKGVLLVAAAGNDGIALGSKAEVKYPAAYPTVLAVGGAKADGSPDARSNGGPELDLIAPWTVYTTALGGKYHKEEGTSMAAPQAAAAAALVKALHPDWEPYQVRELLRQTAKDIGAPGVDNKSGYGLLRVDEAVNGQLSADPYEPNNGSGSAKPFPVFSEIAAELSSTGDEDWYAIEAPADGKWTIRYEGMAGDGAVPAVSVSLYTGGKLRQTENTKLSSDTFEFQAAKGKHMIRVRSESPIHRSGFRYKLISGFEVAADRYEPNDTFASAYVLQPKSQTIEGNFHQTADRDWFSIEFKQDGKLQLFVTTDTARIDPGLSFQRQGQSLKLYDEQREGETESSPVISVTPGKYYIRVHNAISTDASPTVGSYKLTVDYKPELSDPNEPNDKSYEALTITPGNEYVGVIDKKTDEDWFQFRLAKQSAVRLQITGVPTSSDLVLESFDKRMTRLMSANTGTSGKMSTRENVLEPGVYYVKLTSDKPFNSQYYRLSFTAEELVSGYKDIADHWARDAIAGMTRMGVVSGTGQYRFEPDRSITRAEAVVMLAKAYKPLASSAAGSKKFTDIKSSHWAYDAIMKAAQQGWVQGFPDGSFKPNQPITRAEMAVMIGRAEGLKPRIAYSRPFDDVAPYDWYAPMLNAMLADGKLKGVGERRFEPDGKASRAAFATLVYRYLTD